MDSDLYSLNNLRDIVVPDPPPFWPPASGLWIAMLVVSLAVFLAVWRWRVVQNRNAYRKAGTLLLNKANTTHDVSVVVKRVALAAFPREQVASLYGNDWLRFLDETCPRGDFSPLFKTDESAELNAELVGLARTWILHHRVPDHKASVPTN